MKLLTLEFEQLPCFETERLCNQRQIPHANLNLAGLHFRQVTAVDPQSLCHLELCPAALLPECADSPA